MVFGCIYTVFVFAYLDSHYDVICDVVDNKIIKAMSRQR